MRYDDNQTDDIIPYLERNSFVFDYVRKLEYGLDDTTTLVYDLKLELNRTKQALVDAKGALQDLQDKDATAKENTELKAKLKKSKQETSTLRILVQNRDNRIQALMDEVAGYQTLAIENHDLRARVSELQNQLRGHAMQSHLAALRSQLGRAIQAINQVTDAPADPPQTTPTGVDGQTVRDLQDALQGGKLTPQAVPVPRGLRTMDLEID